MKQLVYISDFFVSDIQGGAEICDNVLLNKLTSQGIKVVMFRSNEITPKHINLYIKCGFVFLVSNFINLSEESKKTLQVYKNKYSIIEHDHKYLTTRNPAYYENYIAPKEHIINKSFYENAKNVFCQSIKHYDVVKKNLNINNIHNLGCSLWDEQQIKFLKKNCENQKNNKTIILKSSNPIKGFSDSVEYCKTNNLDFDIVETTNYENYILQVSKYEKIALFPKSLETFNRTLLEARMLNVKIATNNLNGCTYESWFKDYKGISLINFVENKTEEVVSFVNDKLFNDSQDEQQIGDITVILNCYRRPYNLQMQIEAIKSQSIKPKQIWIWVNNHEDNRDFDFSSIKVDRIFRNDYNWKFYGRFAAALLSDTEYVAVYDDDTIPGSKWHENCLTTMQKSEGILGSAGIILNGNRYIQHDRCGWPTQNEQTTEVDLVGHAWFFKRQWLQYLWKEKPFTWDNGEDIQFSYMSKVHGNIKTFCPPHPKDDVQMHGSILGNELGIDSKATSNNNAVSHQQFFTERDLCVQNGIRNGWNTVKGIKI